MTKAIVADKMASWMQADGEVRWTSFDAKRLILEESKSSPPWPPMCCWEMPMLAALLTNNLDKKTADTVYDNIMKTNGMKLGPLVKSSSTYKGTVPGKGDLVFFTSKAQGELAHVALATGDRADKEAIILSFWAIEVMMLDIRYKEELKAGKNPDLGAMTTALKKHQKEGSPARVTMTTIEGMAKAIEALTQSKVTVKTGVPIWG